MYGPMMGNWDQMLQWMWQMQLVWMLSLLITVTVVLMVIVVRFRRPSTPIGPTAKLWVGNARFSIMVQTQHFTTAAASEIADALGIDWTVVQFDLEQFQLGLDVELEHGQRDPATNVTGDDPVLTGKIALAHLKELPDYYTRLAAMEEPVTETPAGTRRRTGRAREWT